MSEGEYIKIDENRLKHILQAGRKAQKTARDIFGWDELKCRQMFILGFLHDCGYEFSVDQTEHENLGGELLRTLGFTHWREVYYHGKVTSEYSSDELLILNYADLTTSSTGEDITTEQRLEDILERYGEDSIQYINAARLVESVEQQLKEVKSSRGL